MNAFAEISAFSLVSVIRHSSFVIIPFRKRSLIASKLSARRGLDGWKIPIFFGGIAANSVRK